MPYIPPSSELPPPYPMVTGYHGAMSGCYVNIKPAEKPLIFHDNFLDDVDDALAQKPKKFEFDFSMMQIEGGGLKPYALTARDWQILDTDYSRHSDDELKEVAKPKKTLRERFGFGAPKNKILDEEIDRMAEFDPLAEVKAKYAVNAMPTWPSNERESERITQTKPVKPKRPENIRLSSDF